MSDHSRHSGAAVEAHYEFLAWLMGKIFAGSQIHHLRPNRGNSLVVLERATGAVGLFGAHRGIKAFCAVHESEWHNLAP
jgi:hypothetical protein